MADGARSQARRGGAPDRRPASPAQVGAGRAGHPRDGEDSHRGRGRSAGDDRHLRLRDRSLSPTLRALNALRAPGPPHVRAVAPAGRGRGDLGVQLPGRGVELERGHRRGVWGRHAVEAVQPDPAHGDRMHPHRGGGCARERIRSRDLLAGGGAGLHRGRSAPARPAHPARIRHRQLPDGLPGGSGGGQAAGPHHPRAGRQQRHHRHPARQHGPGAARDPVRFGGHRRAALHQYAPHHRARVHPRGAGAAAGFRLWGRAHRRPARSDDADGSRGEPPGGRRPGGRGAPGQG